MSVRRAHRHVAALGIAALAIGVLTIAPHVAAAAPVQGGQLRVHGPGSLYAGDFSNVSAAVTAGTTATFSFQVINKGSQRGQFLVRADAAGVAATPSIVSSTIPVNAAIFSAAGYYTRPLGVGQAQTFTLKVTVPKTTGQGEHVVVIYLFDTGGNFESFINMFTEVVGPVHGTSAGDIYGRNGGQKLVGGDGNQHLATAPTFKPPANAGFVVRFQNDGTTARSVIGGIENRSACPEAWDFTAKQGSVDKTAAFKSNTFQTPVLAPGAHVDITVTVKAVAAGFGCSAGIFEVSSYDTAADAAADPAVPLQTDLNLIANVAAS